MKALKRYKTVVFFSLRFNNIYFMMTFSFVDTEMLTYRMHELMLSKISFNKVCPSLSEVSFRVRFLHLNVLVIQTDY